GIINREARCETGSHVHDHTGAAEEKGHRYTARSIAKVARARGLAGRGHNGGQAGNDRQGLPLKRDAVVWPFAAAVRSIAAVIEVQYRLAIFEPLKRQNRNLRALLRRAQPSQGYG